jgi:nucleoside-diphosphate-sugar epimerase
MAGRVLLTGATGFIGRALHRRLIADGDAVTTLALDLLEADDKALDSALAGERFDRCIHAAWYTNHADYLVHEVNHGWVDASLRLADAFARAGGGRFVALGTCIEDDGRTLYGRCKRALREALGERGRDFAWPLIHFVYGPGDRPGRLIPHIIESFAKGEPAGPTYGGLRRDYVHVDDLAGQIARIAAAQAQGAIDIGTGAAPTLSEIFSTAAELFGDPALALTNDRIAEDQPLVIEADLSRFRAEIGDPEPRSLRDGLAPLVEAAR